MGAGKSFAETDSWTVALLFVTFALLSVVIEKLVHWLKHVWAYGRKTLLEVIHKGEEELFLLGTVSFILLVLEEMIIKGSCVDSSSTFAPSTWAICPPKAKAYGYTGRHLTGGAGAGGGTCPEGQEPFFSQALLHQVHLFIFFLAISHVLYSASTLYLGKRRLVVLLRKRKAHMEKTMGKIAKAVGSDAHCLVAVPSKKGSMKVHPAATPDDSVVETSGDSIVSITIDKQGSVEEKKPLKKSASDADIAQATAAALKGQDGSGESRSLAQRLGEISGFSLPETTLVCFEILFMRTHNIQSHKFDFADFILECIEADSSDILGMSPSRWLIATLLILFWGIVDEIHLIVSLVSLVALVAIAAKLRRTVMRIIEIERKGGAVTDDLFWFRRPQLIEEIFTVILYQQAFHIASWLFGAWQIGVGSTYACYYGVNVSVWLSSVIIAVSFILGGYVILPLQALVSQMSGRFREELLGPHIKAVMKEMTARMKARRRPKRFATQEEATIAIQRAFRARRARNLEKAAKIAMMGQ